MRDWHPHLILTAGIVLFILCLFVPGCSNNSENFSQYPGFAEYFEAHPPSSELPDQKDKELIYRYRPRFMLAEGNQMPVDFYRDYISSGVLKNGDGEILSRRVTQEILNEYRDEPETVFEHVERTSAGNAVVYGAINRITTPLQRDKDRINQPLTFLSYHMVFRTSGLPFGIPGWQEAILDIIGDVNDWHQLDHYTAVFLVLAGDGVDKEKPIAVMLQQHNNVRTYLFEERILMPLDKRVVIDVAKRSNELYPHNKGRTEHRAVNMPDPASMHFLLSGKKKPLLGGCDVTDSALEVNYELSFLPPDDAFYTFKGFLGEKRLLPGRTGPQGAYYNTLPELKPLDIQLFSGYWREDHAGDLDRLKSTIMDNGDYVGFALLQKKEFIKTMKDLEERYE
ncbi:MAG: hypothetical protein JSW20_10015 [Nitrospiraceae bacterium]|nr:MAG: hypothetical protein JSW20_10015 [Nitrospiraceae bacterium]